MELLEVVLRDLVRGPANYETFILGCAGLGNNMEVNVVDFLVSETAVVLGHT